MKFRHLLLATSIAAVSITSCGGSGGSGGGGGGNCSADAYVPNYVAAPNLTLRHWPNLTVKVFFKTNTPINSTTIEQECRDGFNQWESILGQDLWTEVSSESAANLVVTVETVAPQSTLGITTVYFTQGQSTIQRAEITLYTWASLPSNSYEGTATHEFGHAMGIGGHSNSSLDIMYFTGNATDLITIPDLNTLRTAYCDTFASSPLTRMPTQIKGPLVSESISCPIDTIQR